MTPDDSYLDAEHDAHDADTSHRDAHAVNRLREMVAQYRAEVASLQAGKWTPERMRRALELSNNVYALEWALAKFH